MAAVILDRPLLIPFLGAMGSMALQWFRTDASEKRRRPCLGYGPSNSL
jgi:hypothetical protein